MVYFVMTDIDHVDLILNTDDQRVESERQDKRISTESDSDTEITKYAPPPKYFEKSSKQSTSEIYCTREYS